MPDSLETILARIDERTKTHNDQLKALRQEYERDNKALREELGRYVELARYIWVERAVIGVIGLALATLLGAIFSNAMA